MGIEKTGNHMSWQDEKREQSDWKRTKKLFFDRLKKK
jgi:hypothetical protein